MDKRFLTAFLLPEKTEIAGYKLDPFCFRHLITLEAIDSPYVKQFSNEKVQFVPSVADSLILLKICSSKDWNSAFNDNLKTKITDFIFVKMGEMSIEKYADINLKITTYLQDSLSVPKTWAKSGSKTVVHSKSFHESIMSVTALMSKLNLTEDVAWNMPISRATWYLTAFAKMEGAEVDVITTSQEESVKTDLENLNKFEKEALNKYSKLIKDRKVKL